MHQSFSSSVPQIENSYLFKSQSVFVKIKNVFHKIKKVFVKKINLFVWIANCICLNCKSVFVKIPNVFVNIKNVFVKIEKCICQMCASQTFCTNISAHHIENRNREQCTKLWILNHEKFSLFNVSSRSYEFRSISLVRIKYAPIGYNLNLFAQTFCEVR